MSKRIPAKLKAQLGETLADYWYRGLGKVKPRRPYHEDDEGTGGAANKMFEDHPFLMEAPIGAPSDLASIIVEDARTLDEAKERGEDMTEELQNRLTLALGQKLEKQYRHTYTPKPQPY